jgi:hypothetical protein
MSDRAFLSEFITEPLYLIKEELPASSEYKEEVAEQEPAVVEEPEVKVELKPIFTSGDNLKGCIILVDWKNGEVSAEKELLLKILGSVKRTETDVLIAHTHDSSSEQMEALLAEQNHKHVLDFGTSKIPNLQPADFYKITANGPKKLLKAHPLSEIATDTEKKKMLWNALKEMFL